MPPFRLLCNHRYFKQLKHQICNKKTDNAQNWSGKKSCLILISFCNLLYSNIAAKKACKYLNHPFNSNKTKVIHKFFSHYLKTKKKYRNNNRLVATKIICLILPLLQLLRTGNHLCLFLHLQILSTQAVNRQLVIKIIVIIIIIINNTKISSTITKKIIIIII